jgi:RimJ/RimL family protein N-acetyltransferase
VASTDRLPERIEGEGLLLRRWTVGDAAALAAAVAGSADHLRPWMAWMDEEPRPPAERSAMLKQWEDDWNAGGDVLLAVIREGEIAGSCGLHRRLGPDGLEIGYWIAAPYLRQGLGTAVARALTETALTLPGISRVEIHHDRSNQASAAIPAGLGYELVEERAVEARAPSDSGVECVWRTATAPASRP